MSGIKVSSLVACVAVVGVAGMIYWPRFAAREIRLVSPDGKSAVWITATNSGARIQVMSVNNSGNGLDGSNWINIEAPSDAGASIGITTDREGITGPSIGISTPSKSRQFRAD